MTKQTEWVQEFGSRMRQYYGCTLHDLGESPVTIAERWYHPDDTPAQAVAQYAQRYGLTPLVDLRF